SPAAQHEADREPILRIRTGPGEFGVRLSSQHVQNWGAAFHGAPVLNDNAIRRRPRIISPGALICAEGPPAPPGSDGHAWEVELGGDFALATTGRATHGKVKLGRRAVVVVIAGAHDRPHRAGVEQTVANKPLVDIHPDHLAEYHVAVGGTA